MNLMIIASVITLAIVVLVAYKGLKQKQPSDSALRQRAVFNTYEQLTFTRLKEILPEANILAHVSFDALLTTKLPRTRRKYEKLFADFVVLNKDCRVIAVIALGELLSAKRSKLAQQQDLLLEAAGYRVIRYEGVPEYQQLRDDFLTEYIDMQSLNSMPERDVGKFDLYSEERFTKMRIYG
ncbi:DUF2726 domain-containing protein [Acinetobacter lanii]|uniref:DUF2726 domain-containing protein n=1 Tax=Acinetobacter lanii TaxID=2715163 RepID=A0A6G8S859_9GAMM|nr:DUF2726 domain-containing protein [Acinetobacter lanii]QIO10113.1 DUF2726 domain-containing protein [Acinetobacter lanii]